MPPSSIPVRAIVALILAAASWGLGTVISKRAVEEIPPLALLVVQLTTSVVALGLVTILSGRTRPAAVGRRALGSGPGALDRLGLLNPGAAYALSLVGLGQITASLSVLLWAVEPVLILGLAWWWLREPITRRLVGWSVVALGGMVLVVWTPGVAGQGLGVLATLAGVGCCAVYSVLTRQRIGDAPSTLRVVLGQQAWALGFAVLLLLAAFVASRPGGLVAAGAGVTAPVSMAAWLSALGSGVVYYALAYGFYLSGLRHVSASYAASAFYLIPVFGVAGGWALLGDRLDPLQWLGAGVVLAGVIAVARSASTEPPPQSSSSRGRRSPESVVEMGES